MPSLDADASSAPSGEKATLVTSPVWPTKRKARVAGRRCQTMTEWSAPPDASCCCVGDHASAVTAER